MPDTYDSSMPFWPTAALDSAHIGDIRGTLGTIREDDVHPRLGWDARLKTLAAIVGSGLIVMAGDNDASIIGASAVSLAIAYALGDVLSLKHSLHRAAKDARGFYLVHCGLIAAAAALVVIPGAPPGLITEALQTLAGVLLPSATVLLLLLCNDRAVLGPWVNGRWTNLFTGSVIAILLLLSIVLTAPVLYPSITGEQILWRLGGGTVLALIAAGVALALRRPQAEPALDRALRPTWRMRPLPQLAPARLTTATRVWIIVLRGSLLLAVGLVVVRVLQLALGQ